MQPYSVMHISMYSEGVSIFIATSQPLHGVVTNHSKVNNINTTNGSQEIQYYSNRKMMQLAMYIIVYLNSWESCYVLYRSTYIEKYVCPI